MTRMLRTSPARELTPEDHPELAAHDNDGGAADQYYCRYWEQDAWGVWQVVEGAPGMNSKFMCALGAPAGTAYSWTRRAFE